VSNYALAGLLVQRAWQGWREGDTLRVEFEAAREVQEQLVAPAVDLPGFKIGSAYAPAKKVGGDFFRVIPESGGGVLVVVGHVSGKGLKAAMTVGAIMGALRDYPSRRPTEVLAHLNRVLYGQVSGFVTCCATLIASDGTMTLANAGNPAPYRNGEEMAVEPGLPLGMLGEVSYAETRYQIAVGDQLTFVSDGVVEATNTQGELYGFERTRAISKQTANAIAEAARQFGQEDDITVVTLTRESGKATASTQHSVPSLSV
jgi:phosphoserine phosphatase RsbU/P